MRPITRDIGNQSKSEQLAEALAQQTRIIIVTIQTFPALFDALDKHPTLASGRYAVIADEAHSSPTGSAASKLKAILGSDEPNGDAIELEEISAEDLLDAAVQARRPNDHISYYAFTATPKAKTLELFGRPPNPDLPASADNKPKEFHLYSMRQAIEEGFILDVLHIPPTRLPGKSSIAIKRTMQKWIAKRRGQNSPAGYACTPITLVKKWR